MENGEKLKILFDKRKRQLYKNFYSTYHRLIKDQTVDSIPYLEDQIEALQNQVNSL